MPRQSKNTSDQNNNEVLIKKDKNETNKRVAKEPTKKVAKSSLVEVVKSPDTTVSSDQVSKPSPKKRQSKTKEVPVVVEEVVDEVVEEVFDDVEEEVVEVGGVEEVVRQEGEAGDVTSSDEEVNTTPKRVRKNVSTDDICSDLDSYVLMIDEEISKLKKASQPGVKFLKGLNKSLKNFKVGFNRFMKKKPKTTRLVNTNAGFSKPVKVSEQMASFIGLPSATELVSRVFVTKFLCQYIKSNDLQNPTDKRQILADQKLSTLLNYYPSAETEPLTYYRMQTYMRPHFL